MENRANASIDEIKYSAMGKEWNTCQTRPLFRYTKTDYICIGAVFLIGLIGCPVSLWGGFRSGFTAYFVAMFAVLTAYLISKKRYFRIGAFEYLAAIVSVAASAVFSISQNDAVNFCLLAVMTVLSCTWFAALGGWNSRFGYIPALFDSTFANLERNTGTVFRSLATGEDGKKTSASRAAIGVLASVPLLAVIIGLLIRGDAAFDGLVTLVFGQPLQVLEKLIVGFVFALLLIAYAVGLKKGCQRIRQETVHTGFIDRTAVNAFLTALSVLYLIYLFSQSVYFFSAFRGLLPDDFSTAEYARRGFFEMSTIAAINFAVVTLAMWAIKRDDKGIGRYTKGASVFIGAFTLVIIGTALSKMIMYIDTYGMTIKRIQTSMFMVFLAAVFVLLIAYILTKKVPVLKISLIIAAVILITAGYIGINSMVGRYNIDAYYSGKLAQIDVSAINDLGIEGIPSLIRLTEDSDPEVREKAEEYLMSNARVYFDAHYDWDTDTETFSAEKEELGSWNLLRANSLREMEQYLDSRGILTGACNYVSGRSPQ